MGWRWVKPCQPTYPKRFTHRYFKRFRWIGGLKRQQSLFSIFNSKSIAYPCIDLYNNAGCLVRYERERHSQGESDVPTPPK